MGEDFIEKRRRQFRRCRDAAFEEILRKQDLFSEVTPESRIEVVGFLLNGAQLEPGQKLWQASQNLSVGRTELYRGKDPVVLLKGEAARIAMGSANGVLAAEVVSVSPADKIVTLRFLESRP